ncbi:MAG: ABC transporter permease [Candidatus Kryptonium sp.]|nr:ABC transporter permease [Candidatus Kryptonium sp.]MCX7762050.1 ABC transporter permease [Candidatus Kryptonium sp.]
MTPFDPITSLDRENLSSLPPLSKVYELTLKDGRKLFVLDYEIQDNLIYFEQKFVSGKVEIDKLQSVKTILFIFGTDNLGRDVFSRTIYGGRFSLIIGILSSLLAFLIGVSIGVISGYFGGIVDKILMRITDVFLAFPKLFLVLVIIAFTQTQTIFSIIIILSLLNWMGISRLVRAEFLRLKEMEFILAVESIGLPNLKIAIKHILPNAITPALISIPFITGDVILTESILSFLGFGIQPPTPTWGNMISEAEKSLVSTWWLPIFPGILISATVLTMNWISDVSQED